MRAVLHTSEEPGHYAYVEKKSEFIADVCHISSLDEVAPFVESIRAQHPKARHVCFAAICGARESQFQERMSDDGEPSGTAGKPILQVLRQSGYTDTVITVTRYFGGILLGAGGLIRAYSTAASAVLSLARSTEIIVAQEFSAAVTYPQYDQFVRLIRNNDGTVLRENFTDKVHIVCAVPADIASRFNDEVDRVFNAQIRVVRGGEVTLT